MSLSEDMLAAADMIDTLNTRFNYGDRVPWSAKELRREAPHVEAEEHEWALRENETRDLAATIYETMWNNRFDDALDPERYRRVARLLLECGWHKSENYA